MVFPKTINIYGLKVKIIYSKEQLYIGDSPVDGYADLRNNIIAITENESKLHTLLHEMSHILFARLGIHRAGLSPEIEEIIVDGFATMITEQFKISFK